MSATAARLGSFFGLDSTWERDRPPLGRADALLVLIVEAVGLFSLELVRSIGAFDDTSTPVWVQWLAISTASGALGWRRRFPLLVGGFAAAHMFVLGVTMPMVMSQMSLQVAYFIAFFSAVSWARDRRLMLLVVGAIVIFMFAWVAWQLAVGSGLQEVADTVGTKHRSGLFSPIVASVLLTLILNVLYFGGAVIGGQFAWRGARQHARLVAQRETIAQQGQELRRRAVLDERLRIARELHDVVGHHVSVIGVQAGAARRVLPTDPSAATGALTAIEDSAREAVTQLRGLLGTLREVGGADSPPTDGGQRSPEPDVTDVPELVATRSATGLAVTYDLVEEPEGAAAALPGPVSLTLYRTAQEGLANVARHSTAARANVVVRVRAAGPGAHAEVEVVDAGRPRGGTFGGGLGQVGIRERAQALGGTVEIGPRAMGGYRVRIRIPLGGEQ